MFRFFQNTKRSLDSLLNLITNLVADGLLFCRLLFRSRTALGTEVLFLRKQLAFYEERQVQPRRLNESARFSLILWSRLCNWKEALVIVKPETLISWHRKGFKLFWKWKSQAGRPRLPESIRKLIVQMAQENPTWGQARVAELSVKLGIYVSPRTVRAYWPPEPKRRGHRGITSQTWRTFVRNHALCVPPDGGRHKAHRALQRHRASNGSLDLAAACEAIPSDHSYRFLIHDRDSIFSAEVDEQLKNFGLRVLHTPARAPKANAYCERLVGSVRRECLDFMIPLGEKHLRRILSEWVTHYKFEPRTGDS
jgi:putative transposase